MNGKSIFGRAFKRWVGLLLCSTILMVNAQRAKAQCAEQVLALDSSLAEPIIALEVAGGPATFLAALAAYNAVKLCAWSTEPLENYEVSCKDWHGHYEDWVDLFDSPEPYSGWGETYSYTYAYDPVSQTQTEDSQVIYQTYVIEGSNVYLDEYTYSKCSHAWENTSYTHTYYDEIGAYSSEGYGSVDNYYCMRRGGWPWGRPVRVHVSGGNWDADWNASTLIQTYVGPYSFDEFVYCPKYWYATFRPTVRESSTLGIGYATNCYEIFD